MQQTAYGMRKTLDCPFDEAIGRVTEALKEEEFGVLTEIDVKETLKKKLDVAFSRYTILGACNPKAAYQALQAEREIGLLMPCNVIVYEEGEGSVVSIQDPLTLFNLVGREEVKPLAEEVRGKLLKVLERL
ncbi:MAG: DUF302 domain-containing protein [Candidatus Glassbacteria bacterium]